MRGKFPEPDLAPSSQVLLWAVTTVDQWLEERKGDDDDETFKAIPREICPDCSRPTNGYYDRRAQHMAAALSVWGSGAD